MSRRLAQRLKHMCVAGTLVFIGALPFVPLIETLEYCARFEFPDLAHPNLTAAEDSRLNISFRFVFNTLFPVSSTPGPSTTTITNDNNDNQCLMRRRILITVTQTMQTKGGFQHEDYCRVRVNASGLCQSFSHRRCRCNGDQGSGKGGGAPGGEGGPVVLLLSKTVGKRDEGWWTWWTQDRLVASARIFLRISEKVPREEEKHTSKYANDTDNLNDEVVHLVTDDVRTTGDTKTSLSLNDAKSIHTPHTTIAANADKDDDNNNNGSDSESNRNLSDSANENDDNHNDDDGADQGDVATAGTSSVSMPYVGAIVAGVNISTAIVIGLVVAIVRSLCCNKRDRGRCNPPPPHSSTNATMRGRRSQTAPAQYSSNQKRFSTSSTVYDEIPDDFVVTSNITDTSIYLHPIECITTITTTTTPAAAATATTTFTITK